MLVGSSIVKLLNSPVRTMVTKRLIGVISGTPLRVAVARMLDFDIGFLAITREGKVVGYITKTNVMKAVAGGLLPDVEVDRVMSTELLSVDVNTSVREALELMSKKRVRHLLVTSGDDVEGIVTLRDLEDITRQKLETHISRE